MDSESLEVLNLNYKEFRSLIETEDQRVLLLDVKAVVLVGAYVIFQGIMYGQVNPPSAVLHGNVWIPICLSASVSVAFWLAFIETVNDCMRTRRQQESAFMEQEKLYRKIYSIRTGRRRNDGADAAAHHQSLANALAFVRRQRYAYVGALHFALFFFTLLVSYALLSIPNKVGGGSHQMQFRLEFPPSTTIIQFVSR